MIKQIKFLKTFKVNWKKGPNTHASLHAAGVQFYKDDLLVNLVPYSQIKEIIYE